MLGCLGLPVNPVYEYCWGYIARCSGGVNDCIRSRCIFSTLPISSRALCRRCFSNKICRLTCAMCIGGLRPVRYCQINIPDRDIVGIEDWKVVSFAEASEVVTNTKIVCCVEAQKGTCFNCVHIRQIFSVDSSLKSNS